MSKTNPISTIPTTEALSDALLANSCCSSLQEAVAVADAILEDVYSDSESTRTPLMDGNETFPPNIQQRLVDLMQEYFSSLTTAEEAQRILEWAMNKNQHDDDSSLKDESEKEHVLAEDIRVASQGDDGIDDSNDGDVFVGEGECELCERSSVELTKHHLIPKSTHARLETKLWHASEAIQRGDCHRARAILGIGLEHVVTDDSSFRRDAAAGNHSSSKASVRKWLLQQTCYVCRPCHSAIHRTHDNMTLAMTYNTVEKLIEDEEIYKFCHWASKQRPGQYAVMR